MKPIALSFFALIAFSSNLISANATFGFPDSYSNIVAEEGKFDATSGDVIFAEAEHESGATIEVSYNSRVPVTNEEMPKFLEFMSSKAFGNSRFENGKVLEKEGVNWCIVDLTNPNQPENEKIKIVFVSFDGSPMKMTFRASNEVDLDQIVLEYIDHNNKALVEQIGVSND